MLWLPVKSRKWVHHTEFQFPLQIIKMKENIYFFVQLWRSNMPLKAQLRPKFLVVFWGDHFWIRCIDFWNFIKKLVETFLVQLRCSFPKELQKPSRKTKWQFLMKLTFVLMRWQKTHHKTIWNKRKFRITFNFWTRLLSTQLKKIESHQKRANTSFQHKSGN